MGHQARCKVHDICAPDAAKVGIMLDGRKPQFQDELLALDRELGEYVIVHELLHFSVPNHGKLWKSRMMAHLGDYERLASRLPGIRPLVQERG